MYAFIVRKILYNIPVYLGIILLVMIILRINDPVYAFLGKGATPEQVENLRHDMKLDQPFYVQYGDFLGHVVTLDFSERSWDTRLPVGRMLASAAVPSVLIDVPAFLLTTLIAISVAIIAAYWRGSLTDRMLMFAAVMGMSVSLLVYVIFGQYLGAAWPRDAFGVGAFAIYGYRSGLSHWPYYCLLPVIITVLLSVGYDTRFYRAVMVEECNKDYIVTAMAKGASKPKIMFVHMLKNAMIPIITQVMITLPFLITGSIVVEVYFGIPGMGRTLITAITGRDFPVIQAFTAIFAAVFIATNILTDVLYALVDPRVRLA